METEQGSIDRWWPMLRRTTRAWLIEKNGDAVPANVVEEITAAGGAVTSGAWWVGEIGESGLFFSDDAVDWIEAAANEERPETRG